MFGSHLSFVGREPKSVVLEKYEGEYVNGNIFLINYISTNHMFEDSMNS